MSTMSAPAPVITVRDLSKTFSLHGTQQHVLRNVNLEIARGEFTVIMGPSGSGKSTLLYALSGMDTPTLGSIDFAGTSIAGMKPGKLARFRRTHCGFVFQQVHLLDALSVKDNAMAVGLLGDRARVEVSQRADELFDLVGLDAATRRKMPSMLSGGEAQRAGMVRALIAEPTVVFADEPTGQLNSTSGADVLDLLSKVNSDGQTLVMVTHDVRSAVRGDRILYLRDGGIQGELELGRWHGEDPARTERLTAFLTQMGW